jgi:hypothetical protein
MGCTVQMVTQVLDSRGVLSRLKVWVCCCSAHLASLQQLTDSWVRCAGGATRECVHGYQ